MINERSEQAAKVVHPCKVLVVIGDAGMFSPSVATYLA